MLPRFPVRSFAVAALVAGSLFVVACGNDDDDDNGVTETPTEATAEESPTESSADETPTVEEEPTDEPTEEPTEDPTEDPANGGSGEEVTLEIGADNLEFDKDTLTAPAGAAVTVTLTNHEAVPHNFSVYESEGSDEVIFEGEFVSGPDESIDYEFDAPEEPGTYFFVCDVHPTTMTGDFIVE